MSESEMTRAKEIDDAVKAADAKKRADAEEAMHNGEKLDNILKHLDSLGKRMDAYDAKMDAERWQDPTPAEKVYGIAKGDGDDGEDPDAPRKIGADSRADSIRLDAEEIEHFKAVNGVTRPVPADSVLASIQSHADVAASAWGKSAVHPWDVDLATLNGQTLRNATAQIFSDSIAASSSPATYGETLREVRRRDPDSGHLIKEYYGEPRAWMQQFAGGLPRLARFNIDAINRR
jgi:hypothetical protein